LSRLRRQKKNARIARRAIIATGTTTAIAIVPLLDKPPLVVCGTAVLLEVDEVEVFDVVDEVEVPIPGVEEDVGEKVLVEV
jgi:hypothetical protein